MIMYMCALIDIMNIATARVYNLDVKTNLGAMERDLHMKVNDINNVYSFYYILYCLFEPFSNFFLIKFKPSVWLSRIMVSHNMTGGVMSTVTERVMSTNQIVNN